MHSKMYLCIEWLHYVSGPTHPQPDNVCRDVEKENKLSILSKARLRCLSEQIKLHTLKPDTEYCLNCHFLKEA